MPGDLDLPGTGGSRAPGGGQGGLKGVKGSGAAAEVRGGTREGPAEIHSGGGCGRGDEDCGRIWSAPGTSGGGCKGLAVVTSDQSSLPVCGHGPQAWPTKGCVAFQPQSYGRGGMEYEPERALRPRTQVACGSTSHFLTSLCACACVSGSRPGPRYAVREPSAYQGALNAHCAGASASGSEMTHTSSTPTAHAPSCWCALLRPYSNNCTALLSARMRFHSRACGRGGPKPKRWSAQAPVAANAGEMCTCLMPA